MSNKIKYITACTKLTALGKAFGDKYYVSIQAAKVGLELFGGYPQKVFEVEVTFKSQLGIDQRSIVRTQTAKIVEEYCCTPERRVNKSRIAIK